MRTDFSPAALAQPGTREAADILRACVHCGICTAVCPTYVLLGDERDSPRGRIYLIREMFGRDQPPTGEEAVHLDRCLGCLACQTACPSGVRYGRLAALARERLEHTHRRPLPVRLFRKLLFFTLARPNLFRLALLSARLLRPFRRLAPAPLRTMLELAPWPQPPSPVDRPRVYPATGRKGKPPLLRAALLNGCVQKVLDPSINRHTISLLARHGVEVHVVKGLGCCGALEHHAGQDASPAVIRNLQAVADAEKRAGAPFDVIVSNASGCGLTLKEYGHIPGLPARMAEEAASFAARARDLSEVLAETGLATLRPGTGRIRLAHHGACALTHGQGLGELSDGLLSRAGFRVTSPAEGHLCCGSAGIYNLVQPEIALQLRDRKVGNLERTGADAVVAGNIGCLVQLGSAAALRRPILHTAEVLDWATGGESALLDRLACQPGPG